MKRNRAAARRFYSNCLQNGRENQNNTSNIRFYVMCHFWLWNSIEIATCDRAPVIKSCLGTSKYWLFRWFYRRLRCRCKMDDFLHMLKNLREGRRWAAAQTWWFLGRFIGKLRHGSVGMMHVWEGSAHLDLRFPMFLGPRTLSLHACAAKSPKAELRLTRPYAILGGFGPRGEPLKEGETVTMTFIPDTVYLLLDTWQ